MLDDETEVVAGWKTSWMMRWARSRRHGSLPSSAAGGALQRW